MLIACPECSGQVSDKAKACPHCGYPVKELGSGGEEETLIEVTPGIFGNNPFMHLMVGVLCLVVVGLIWYLVEWLRCRSTQLVVTTQRTILRTGILSKQTSEVRHSDIRNIQVVQGAFERMLKVGTLELSSAAQSDIEIVIKGVPDPQGLATLIRKNQ